MMRGSDRYVYRMVPDGVAENWCVARVEKVGGGMGGEGLTAISGAIRI